MPVRDPYAFSRVCIHCYWSLCGNSLGGIWCRLYCWTERCWRIPSFPIQPLQENTVIVHVFWCPGVPLQGGKGNNWIWANVNIKLFCTVCEIIPFKHTKGVAFCLLWSPVLTKEGEALISLNYNQEIKSEKKGTQLFSSVTLLLKFRS